MCSRWCVLFCTITMLADKYLLSVFHSSFLHPSIPVSSLIALCGCDSETPVQHAYTPQLWYCSTCNTGTQRHTAATCPGLCCLSSSQRSSCLGTLGSSPAFHIQVQHHEAEANSWRCAEGAWRLPQQMNHHGLIFNSRLLLPSSISPSSPLFHTAFFLHLFITPSPSSAGKLAYVQVLYCKYLMGVLFF